MIGGLWGPRTFLDADVEAWLIETWDRLLDRFGPERALSDTPVVLPTREFFPASEAVGHERAVYLFDIVRGLMGMGDWPCRLETQPVRASGARLDEFVFIGGGNDPSGTFRIDKDGPLITYAPDLVSQPMELVAVFAHELAHYLMAGDADLFEDETHELMTDLAVVYTGFGIFGANTAFSFTQHGDAFGQGWRSSRNGYLSPRSWAFALALFGEARGDHGAVGDYLKPEVETLRRKAVTYLRRNPELVRTSV